MNNKTILTLAAMFITLTFFAQKFEVRINAGANLTFIPDYVHWIYVANDGLIVPGLISINNSVTPVIVGTSIAETNARLGFLADLEIRMKVCDKCSLSLAAGISRLNYGYDNYIDIEGTPNVRLGELSSDFGNTCLLYLNVRPLNFGIDLFNDKLTLQGGATFNFFLKGKSNNTVVLYAAEPVVGGTEPIVEKLYMVSASLANSILYGAYFRVEYNILSELDVFISSQYYFNPIFESEESNYLELKATKPIIVDVGLSFTFWKF